MKRLFTSAREVSRLQSIFLLVAIAMTPFLSFGQDLPVTNMPVTLDLKQEFGPNTLAFRDDPRTSKISAGLLATMDMFEKGEDLTDSEMFQVEGNKILIQAFAKSEADAADLLSSLTAMGMTHGVSYKHVVNGMLPFNKIDATKDIPSMRSISYSVKPETRIGSVTSQGDVSMGTDQLRAMAGVDGSGLKIGILSDSYNTLGGAAAGVSTGDLPGTGNPNGYTTPVQVLEEYFFTGIDEGRGMAELVHDVAPGSELAFNTAFNGFASFANGIINLRSAGCDVIVDDVSYFAEPYFQDGIIAQAADAVVADGAMYFSSAGNSRNNSIDGPYNPGGFLFDFGGGLVYEPHDWGGGDYFLQVTLQPGQGLNFWLQWDEPSLLAGLIGPSKDLDILLFNETLTSIFAFSLGNNPADGIPVESIRGGNGGATPLVVNIFVGRWAPVPGNPSRLKVVDFQGSNVGSYFENAAEWTKATVVGHSNSAGAIAVGAAAYFNTPAYGVDPAVINAFSSVGGTPILFDPIGLPLPAEEDRFKPDLTGPDGGNTTFFISDYEPDGFPNFFGTSASAPHVAALATLLKAAVPGASNTQIEKILKETAQDMDDPRGIHSNLGDSTFDYATGYGFVDAKAALLKVQNIPTLSEWGLILFVLLITGLGLTTIYSVKYAPALSSGGQMVTKPGFKFFFDRQLFARKLPQGLLAMAVGAVLILIFWGEILTHDIVGLFMVLPLVTYILHIMDVLKENKA
ncbi:MAG: IPTL-CTERM sorting domain-containing protein [Saprospiraceae bacterium]|nr:IPTL-CTERM sorting domain-containing protein [Lewinella sp.]